MGVRNSLDLESDPRAIIGTRLYDAPRELVWTAWTDPKHLAQWWGPNGFTTTTSKFEFKPGGIWRFVMRGPDGREYQNRVIFDEIVKPERIVYRHDGAEEGVEPVTFTQTVTFENAGGKTLLTWKGVFPTAADRNHIIREYGADKGLTQTMARLADYVGTLS